MPDKAALGAVIEAQRRHDLPGVRRACADDGLKHFAQLLCMPILADLGDLDAAFAIAANAYPAWKAPAGANEEQVWLDDPGGFDTAILNGPAGKAMRADPRFLEIAGKLGLIAYWRATRLPDFCTAGHEPECAKIGPAPARVG